MKVEFEKCPICGEEAVKDDVENGQKVRVCIECGAIENDMQDLTSEDQFQGTTVSDGRGHGPEGRKGWVQDSSSRLKKNIQLGTKLITNIGNQLNLAENIIAEACHLYENIYDECLFNSHQSNKKAMCLACLFACGRRNEVPINIRMIGFFLNMDRPLKKFSSALKTLKDKFDVHLPPLNIESETWGTLAHSELSSEIIKTTQQLLLIMQRGTLTTGRPNQNIIFICAYYAYKASDIFKHKKLKLTEFCKKFKLQIDSQRRLKSQVDNLLKSLALELPWMKDQEKENIHIELHIKDIINYQSSLLAQAIQTAVSEMDEEERVKKHLPDSSDDTNVEPGYIFRKVCKQKSKRTDHDFFDICESHSINKKPRTEKREGYQSDNANAGNSSGLESFDLGSDDDTDMYIIPLHEVKMRQEMQKKYGLHDEN